MAHSASKRLLSYILQYRDTANDSARGTRRSVVFNHIVIDIVVINLSVDLAVPAEIFAVGGIDECAPAVVNPDVEHSVADVVEVGLGDAELVVQTVAVRRDGVGQEELVFAGYNRVGSFYLAGSLRCCPAS